VFAASLRLRSRSVPLNDSISILALPPPSWKVWRRRGVEPAGS